MRTSGGMAALFFIACCLLAAALRLFQLGATDTKGDEVELLIPPIANFGPLENFTRDFHAFKEGRILGVPRMAASALVKGFGLETNRYNVRLTYALMGILTIPALFLLGLRLGDRRLAWILAFLGAINPCLILYARQAHVYAFPLCLNVWIAAFGAGVIQALRRKERPRISDVVWLCAASVLACHSHMSSWPFAGLLWALILGLLIAHRNEPFARAAARGLGLAFGLWILSLLPWIFIFISALFTARESFLGGAGFTDFLTMWRLPFVMTWGGGWPRGIVTVGLLSAGIAGGLAAARWRIFALGLLGFSLTLFGALSVFMGLGSGFFQMRYYTPLWVIFNLTAGLGVLLLSERIAGMVQRCGSKSFRAEHAMIVLCAVAALCALAPIGWILSLPGNPTPYTMINRWMDANLPKGTLVIVDRWFEPWNEMKYHAPSNVVATFTIPSEPYENMMKYNWPQTVKNFFKQFPDSAYLEMCKTSPDIGRPWDWPRRHFRRHAALTNVPALLLRRAVLAPDGWYGADMSRLVVEVFYNTREDAVEQARAAGQTTLVCYGAGWGYVKLWQQFRDFRDWRVLEDKAALEVYNLTSQTMSVTLRMRGMAANGAKRVRFGMLSQADFQNMQLAEWRIENVPLNPGLNRFVLTDALWSAVKIPWLVDQVEVVEEEVRGQKSEVDSAEKPPINAA